MKYTYYCVCTFIIFFVNSDSIFFPYLRQRFAFFIVNYPCFSPSQLLVFFLVLNTWTASFFIVKYRCFLPSQLLFFLPCFKYLNPIIFIYWTSVRNIVNKYLSERACSMLLFTENLRIIFIVYNSDFPHHTFHPYPLTSYIIFSATHATLHNPFLQPHLGK